MFHKLGFQRDDWAKFAGALHGQGEDDGSARPRLDVAGACLSVIGALGESFGILLFPSLAGYDALGAAAERLSPGGPLDLGTTCLSLAFVRGADIPQTMRRESEPSARRGDRQIHAGALGGGDRRVAQRAKTPPTLQNTDVTSAPVIGGLPRRPRYRYRTDAHRTARAGARTDLPHWVTSAVPWWGIRWAAAWRCSSRISSPSASRSSPVAASAMSSTSS